jgi:hypothetical protein
MPARQPSPVAEWLVLVLAAITGYLAWQFAPLTARMNAIERDQLATKDALLAELEKLARQVAAVERRNPPPAASEAVQPSKTPAPVPPPRAAPPSPSQSATASSPNAELEFFDRHLLPSDATIARMMIGKAAPADIARTTNHSVAFVLARGRQIEVILARAHYAPPELLRAIHEYLKERLPPR